MLVIGSHRTNHLIREGREGKVRVSVCTIFYLVWFYLGVISNQSASIERFTILLIEFSHLFKKVVLDKL